MRRRLLAALITLSLAACLALIVLRARSAKSTDVLMLAFPRGHCFLLTSHEGLWGWVTVSHVSPWTDRGIKAWTARNDPTDPRLRGRSWSRAGPFLFWQRHAATSAGQIGLTRGTVAVPTDDGGRLPAYGDGVARADACDAWRGIAPNQPGWLFLSGWEVRVPHTYLIAATAVLPLVVAPVWLARLHRRRRRAGSGLCVGCGYDVRASGERCPECGRPTGRAAFAPAVSDTAPAATAP
jgi:hypothetical protein